MDAPTLYKIVGPGGEPLNGGSGVWPLPHDGLPGDWRDVDGPLVACRNGLHLADATQLAHWLPAQPCVVYRVETRGDLLNAGEKWVAQSVRLLPRSRPMPDFDKAAARRERAVRRAVKARDVTVPARWRAYLSRIGRDVNLPAAHPAAQYQNAVAAAEAAYVKAVRAAEARYAADIADGVRL